jgi:hypothetical protein
MSQREGNFKKTVKSDKGMDLKKDGSLERVLRNAGETSHMTGE